MLDKNNVEIKTGDIVKITGAYTKRHNGLYFVEHSPGDPDWCGRDHCLEKIKRNGEPSTAPYATCFWPIFVVVNDRKKAAEAKAWNEENAQIEVVTGISQAAVAQLFRERSSSLDVHIRHCEFDFGEDSQRVKDYKSYKKFYDDVADRLEGKA